MTESTSAGWLEHLRRPSSLGDLAVVVTLALVLLSLLHVYFVSGFDTSTSQAVLSVTEPTKALQIAVLSFLPAAVSGILLTYIPRFVLVRRRRYWSAPRLMVLLVATVLALPFLLSTSPVTGGVLLLGGVIVGCAERKDLQTRGTIRPPVPVESRRSLLIFVGVASLSVVLTQHWAPLEALDLSSGEDVVGRVVGTQADQVLVIDRDMEAVWVPQDHIEARRLCGKSEGPWYLQSFGSLRSTDPDYELC